MSKDLHPLTLKNWKTLERYNKYEKKNYLRIVSSILIPYLLIMRQLYQKVGYPDPSKVADLVLEQCNKMGKKPSEVAILDMGCENSELALLENS